VRIHVLKRCKELPSVTKKEIENKRRLLAECIHQIEKDTGAKYPPVIVSPCLFFNQKADKIFFGGAATGPLKIKDKTILIVIVTLPTFLHFNKDLILGILAEEFLHYTFFITSWIKGKPPPPKDEEKQHKPQLWFKNPHIIKCYHKAQKQKQTPQQFLKIKQDWQRKGGPISNGTELRLQEIDKLFIPRDIQRKLTQKKLI
jgi:hypothetical protein